MSSSSRKIKKANALVRASYSLDLSEHRLIAVAIDAANGDAGRMTSIRISAQDYAEQWNISLNAAYTALKEASDSLFDRHFSFDRETDRGSERTRSRWVSHVSYVKRAGTIELGFAPHVLPLLAELERRFTLLDMSVLSQLKSGHSFVLYQQLMSWRSVGHTPVIGLAELRAQFGLDPSEYARMGDFKKRVLDSAIKHINERSDIVVSYEQKKDGRKIVGFIFQIREKSGFPTANRDPNTCDWINGKTDAAPNKPKRRIISKSEAEAMAKAGESYSSLYQRLSSDYIIR